MNCNYDGLKGLEKYSYKVPIILRVFFGFFLMLHGIGKLWGPDAFFGLGLGGGLEGWTGMITGMMGLPVIFAYIVALIEFVGGLMIIIGLLTRYWAALGMIVMAVASIWVHFPDGFKTAELPLLIFAGLSCILILGAGRWSVDSMCMGKKKKTK